MTVSELVFLSLGLLLGAAAGIALIETFRTRPSARREVRVTVEQDAIPRRRPSTLADGALAMTPIEPAPMGPADRRGDDRGSAPNGVDRRTTVRFDGPNGSTPPALSASAIVQAPLRPSATLTPVPISSGEDPMLSALRATAASSAVAAMRAPKATAVAVLDRPDDRPTATAGATPPTSGSASTPSPATSGPCAELRRVADERCELATRARERSGAAEDALRAAQRAYDDHESRAEAAARLADPRAVREAKDRAQTLFRHGRSGARTTEEVEAAARAWLLEINRVNAEARDAAAAVTREREAARVLTLELERLAVEADAARIAAETADAACLNARQAAADCDERIVVEETAAEPVVPSGAPSSPFVEETPPVAASRSLGNGGTPRIFRLLRGERAAMTELVAALGGDDAEERRRWQLALSDLVDAIVADSIAASALHFPEDHPFWGTFTLAQCRDIAAALASLGYRFDGLGGWVDGRTPSQRDLSLAVGYGGLDPMRIRHWPSEAEMAVLFQDVTVAADEHLAGSAGDLTLGELVSMLGRRADGLAEVWNAWGRIRPLLLEEH